MKKRYISTIFSLFVVTVLMGCGESTNKESTEQTTDSQSEKLTDKEILVRIYKSMNGAEWTDSQRKNWNSDEAIGEWGGVKTNVEGRVIELRIQGDGVNGLIPAAIGGLSELQQLNIYSKEYSTLNVIPKEIGKLTKLKSLGIAVYSDSKYGTPAFPNLSSLVNLETMYMTGFGGAIPENFSKLSNLKILGINGFEGKIPESICQLSNLEELNLKSGYQPMGEVPGCIGKMAKLKTLVIDYNTGIAGGINQPNVKFPESIWDLTNLEYLFMRSLSNTGGPIPSGKVAKMSNLKSIIIHNCGITGEIPKEFFVSGKLTNFSIYENELTGNIPIEIGNCTSLRTLSLEKNQLTGKIPTGLANCEKLTMVNLSGNKLSSDIPAALKSHPNFSKFKL